MAYSVAGDSLGFSASFDEGEAGGGAAQHAPAEHDANLDFMD